ncbi:MAG: branched-chain amino acid ABC transporter permease [Xanthobacteraceae bacterium]|nr:branched-chain amino acid ABC transporter permease [Xanthobacteraceae bacterium]MCW5678838.1 branched-chain amino acid ABC transporter permease [Xanthobacteraceae bacterium]
MSSRYAIPLLAALTLVILVVLGKLLPAWCVFLLVTAFAKGLAALGLVLIIRSGLLSFGQGLFYCAGGYGAGLFMLWGGVHDAALLVLAGGLVALVLGSVIAPLLAGYRSIFFATLTLALSMLAHGALTKADFLGGSDGLNLRPPSFIGFQPANSTESVYALYVFACILVVVFSLACRVHFNSVRGLLSLAVRDNEIRVEYLGTSVRRVISENFTAAAFLGGIGGALNAIAVAHIDPELAFWTTSGEFVFVAILSGYLSVAAVFASSIALEFIRSFSSQYFPNAWQMSLGIFMLASILFLPNGIGGLLQRRKKRMKGNEPA